MGQRPINYQAHDGINKKPVGRGGNLIKVCVVCDHCTEMKYKGINDVRGRWGLGEEDRGRQAVGKYPEFIKKKRLLFCKRGDSGGGGRRKMKGGQKAPARGSGLSVETFPGQTKKSGEIK